MLKLLIALLVSLFSFGVYGASLDDHISAHCKKGCVDSHQVLNAAVSSADTYDVDFRLVLAIITVESAFIVMAKNMGNKGLMQILVRYHRDKFKTKNFFNVDDNLNVGTRVFKDCLSRTRVLTKALRCYNGNSDPKYASKVLAEYKALKQVTY